MRCVVVYGCGYDFCWRVRRVDLLIVGVIMNLFDLIWFYWVVGIVIGLLVGLIVFIELYNIFV